MTSSLVGSEMCIRDSQKPEELDEKAMAKHVLTKTRTVELSWRRPQESACLLYTSDAADDM
eukprot:3319667-Prorocentrum_lima.AAC.1